jgi:hypothetical protein
MASDSQVDESKRVEFREAAKKGPKNSQKTAKNAHFSSVSGTFRPQTALF